MLCAPASSSVKFSKPMLSAMDSPIALQSE